MNAALSLRTRMMLLFCIVVGVLLAGSYVAFYVALKSVVRSQFDRRLMEAEAPVAADLESDADDQDIVAMNIPGEYFEALDDSGRVVALSKNLAGHVIRLPGKTQGLQRIEDPTLGSLRLGIAQIHRADGNRTLILAMPTRDIDQILARFRTLLLFLFPGSLLLMGGVAAWYVGRSLAPIAALTAETTRMADQVKVAPPGALPNQLPKNAAASEKGIRNDELGRLAEAYDKLFLGMDSALRQLRQFVSDASHELRTPLSVLQGETELLLREPRTPEEYQKALAVIDDELKKLGRIVEGLFTLAIADAGQLQPAREPLYLNEVLEEACSLVASRARTKGIAIERQLAQDIAYVGDEAFLRQLFLIFLDNAVKYSPSQSCIQVRLAASDGTVHVKFADQGPGISAEHLPHIYERFYRVPGVGGSESQSGGLGLAIAQAIVQAHGGSITCTSAPGAGSTFSVLLPCPAGDACATHLNKN